MPTRLPARLSTLMYRTRFSKPPQRAAFDRPYFAMAPDRRADLEANFGSALETASFEARSFDSLRAATPFASAVETDAAAARAQGKSRLRMVLGLVAFVGLAAFATRTPEHHHDPEFLQQVDERYRKIRNDHAVAMYDRAVEDLARVGRDIRAEASILDDSSLFVDPIFDDVYEDEELDTDFWSWTPPSPEPVQRLWR